MRQKNIQPTDHPVIIIIIIITPMIFLFTRKQQIYSSFFLKGIFLKIDVALRDMLDSEQSF